MLLKKLTCNLIKNDVFYYIQNIFSTHNTYKYKKLHVNRHLNFGLTKFLVI